MARSTTSKNSTPDDEPIEPAPTEQLPVAQRSAPVVEPDPQEPPRSFVRRHPVGSGIAAAAILVVLVSGLTAWGVGAAVTASLTASDAATAPAAPAPATGAGKAAGLRARAAGRIAARATITGIDGSTWKVTTRKGVDATVTVDSTTKLGTKRMPATLSSFAVGDTVLIVASEASDSTAGSLSGTAIRVVPAPKSGTEPTPMQTTAPTT
jgi:hypothetical protein